MTIKEKLERIQQMEKANCERIQKYLEEQRRK